ncbi:MAG: ABC transporter permease [Bacteroidota bacterium]
MGSSFSYIIARRLSLQKGSGTSRLIIRIATGAVALSIAVMIISIAIVKGYQSEIRSKIIGFSTHIQISSLDMNNSFETTPIYRDTVLEKLLQQNDGVTHLQPFAIKAGILKTKEDFSGVVLKGVDSAYDWRFLQQHLVSGSTLSLHPDSVSNTILLSKVLADKLKLKVGDHVLLYIAQEPPRVRKFLIVGLYNTGLEEMDKLYAFVDIQQVQRLNQWSEYAVSGYEVGLKNHADIDLVSTELLSLLPYNLEIHTIRDLFPQLFDWLSLLDLNVWVIIILMIIVACINMATALLILIVERSNMIGLLKAMGANNQSVSRIFVYMVSYLIVWGMIIGNIAGIGICLSQYYGGWFKLSQDAYYLSEVPILLKWTDVLFINLGSFIICYLVLLLPAAFVSKVTPIKAIRFQ